MDGRTDRQSYLLDRISPKTSSIPLLLTAIFYRQKLLAKSVVKLFFALAADSRRSVNFEAFGNV